MSDFKQAENLEKMRKKARDRVSITPQTAAGGEKNGNSDTIVSTFLR